MPGGTTTLKNLRTMEMRKTTLETQRAREGHLPYEAEDELRAVSWAHDLFTQVRELEESIDINIIAFARISLAFEFGLYQAEPTPTGEPFFEEGEPEFSAVDPEHLRVLERRRDYLTGLLDELNTYQKAERGMLTWACKTLREIRYLERRLNVTILDLGYVIESMQEGLTEADTTQEDADVA